MQHSRRLRYMFIGTGHTGPTAVWGSGASLPWSCRIPFLASSANRAQRSRAGNHSDQFFAASRRACGKVPNRTPGRIRSVRHLHRSLGSAGLGNHVGTFQARPLDRLLAGNARPLKKRNREGFSHMLGPRGSNSRRHSATPGRIETPKSSERVQLRK
jgi:hypothetical protein